MPTAVLQNQSNERTSRSLCSDDGLGQAVNFGEELMHVSLTDGRCISVPIIWFPVLRNATPDKREEYEIGGGGTSLHWPELDEDLSVAGLMAGADLRTT
ncbi:MAG: hypothetical protein QOG23_434 [Blastocatellia bacterium]|nr:hypothetical protein [Blastocatellia bacterium]